MSGDTDATGYAYGTSGTALAGEAPRCTARGYTGHEHPRRTMFVRLTLF